MTTGNNCHASTTPPPSSAELLRPVNARELMRRGPLCRPTPAAPGPSAPLGVTATATITARPIPSQAGLLTTPRHGAWGHGSARGPGSLELSAPGLSPAPALGAPADWAAVFASAFPSEQWG